MKDTKSMNMSPAFVLGLQKVLDLLIENGNCMAQIGLITIRNCGTIQDTAGGKREVFEIIRKVED